MRLDTGMHVINMDKYTLVPCSYLDIKHSKAKPLCEHSCDNKALPC